ncbi:MAG: glycosyltransferase family 4 protein [Ardenticatenales bacterium]|nr:glycosyltransferase family 4 protein [Ardenticatenales bacterium]
MHIALAAHFWGQPTTGSGQYLHRLVDALVAESGLALTLIGDAAAAQRAAPPAGVAWQTATTPFDGRSDNLAKLWFEQRAAPQLAEALAVDVLHVPYFAPPMRCAVPTVVTIHDLIPMLLPMYRGNALVRGYTALAGRAAPHSAHLIADSEASRRDILDHLSVTAEQVSTVYLGVDAQFHPQSDDAVSALRQRLALPDEFVLYLGGFDVRKNVPLLLEAVACSTGDWPLLIAGKLPNSDTPFTPDPQRLVDKWGLSERVRFLGWVEEADKPALLSAASLFVFPSAYEGFGLPVLEAMACGTATVTSDVSSLPELAGDAALTLPPNDATALQQALDHLMADRDERQRRAALSIVQASAFTWQRCAAETLAIYARAVEADGGNFA